MHLKNYKQPSLLYLSTHRIIKLNTKSESPVFNEVEPEFGEGTIHYIAVREDIRGKGIGSKLLSMALKWAFSFETIEIIELCVNGKNIAEKLY